MTLEYSFIASIVYCFLFCLAWVVIESLVPRSELRTGKVVWIRLLVILNCVVSIWVCAVLISLMIEWS